MTAVRYMTSAEWGMTWARPPLPEQQPDPEAYIHHVGGAAWMNDDAPTVFRQLNTYAQQGKKYAAVDYDILVHYSRGQDVLTIAGARQEWMSAATLDRNELGEAICLCADTQERLPLAIELEGLALAVVYGIEKGWIDPQPTILGHRDNPAHPGATQCPGDFLYERLPTVRWRVAQLLNPPEEDEDVAKIYLAYKKGDRSQLWRGDRLRAVQYSDADRIGLMGRQFNDPRMQHYYSPVTGQRITAWAQVPELTPNQIILDLGAPES